MSGSVARKIRRRVNRATDASMEHAADVLKQQQRHIVALTDYTQRLEVKIKTIAEAAHGTFKVMHEEFRTLQHAHNSTVGVLDTLFGELVKAGIPITHPSSQVVQTASGIMLPPGVSLEDVAPPKEPLGEPEGSADELGGDGDPNGGRTLPPTPTQER